MTSKLKADFGHLLLAFFERLSAWELGVVAESDLSPAQMHALEMLGHMGNPTMKALAGQLGVTTGTLTTMIDRLEKENLVVRQKNPDDRRSTILALTKSGRQHFEQHHQFHIQLTEELSACFSEDELSIFNEQLQRLVERI
ncbi:MAG: MarR family transcriptional regulator [Deltaproteobacteria bacterium]|nr:MarR family transcriptional regulator [Deltaproteobacteria bacterium]